MPDSVKDFGRQADDSTTLDIAVRVGLISYGAVHVLIALLAAQLAFGGGGGSASKNGALAEIASRPLGSTILYVMAAGFVALVVWQLIEMIAGHRDEDGAKRKLLQGASAFKVGIYGFFGYSSFKAALSGGGGGDKSESMTAKALGLPAGQVLVGLIGLAVVGYAATLIYQGLNEEFRDHLKAQGQSGDLGKTYVLFGKVGHVSKGIAFLVVGGLVLWAAWTHDPDKSGGLDQALKTLLEQPYGSVMLGAVALGLGCYGAYCFAWARHLDR